MPDKYDLYDNYGSKVGMVERKSDGEGFAALVKFILYTILIIIAFYFLPIWWGIYLVYKGWKEQPMGRKILWVLSWFLVAIVLFALYHNHPEYSGMMTTLSILYLILGIISIPLAVKIR